MAWKIGWMHKGKELDLFLVHVHADLVSTKEPISSAENPVL